MCVYCISKCVYIVYQYDRYQTNLPFHVCGEGFVECRSCSCNVCINIRYYIMTKHVDSVYILYIKIIHRMCVYCVSI